jgi:hypothetical protein
LPLPGGPTIRRLWAPAAATSRDEILLSVQEVHHLPQVANAEDRKALDDGPLGGVLLGQEQSVDPPAPGRNGYGEGTPDGFDPAVEGEFPHEDEAPGAGAPDDAGSGQKAHGHRQVEGGAVFFDVSGSEVDGDAPGGELVPRVLDGRLDSILAFLDCPLGQPDGGELRKPLGDVDLHLHRVGVDSDQRPGQNLGKHISPSFCAVFFLPLS